VLDDNGKGVKVTLTDVMYIPELSRQLLSVTKFARHAMIKPIFISIKKAYIS
jgi:hypothetical protein